MKEAITHFIWTIVCLCAVLVAVLATNFLGSWEPPSATELLAERGISATQEALITAVENNQARAVELLTDAGVSPDASRDDDGHTALMLAASHGYTGLVEQLTPLSDNLDLTDDHGMTALAHSIGNDQLGIAKKLIAAGAASELSCDEKHALLVATVMHSQLSAMDLLLENGARSGIDDALLIAVTEHKLEFTKRLIECGANPNTGADFEMPVLNIALQNGDKQSARLLLEAGADPNLRDDDSMSALGYAIAEGDAALVAELLAKSADTELSCEKEYTAMEAAVIHGVPQIIETLLSVGGAIIHPRVVSNAIDYGTPEVLATLLDHGASVDTPDSNGETLLARAVRSGDHERVDLLLLRGASPDSNCKEGQPLLALATALKRPACVAALIRAGADPNLRLNHPVSEAYSELAGSRTFAFYAKRDSRFTPIMVAAAHGHAETLRALIENGASNNRYTRSYKRYPISFASEAGNIEAQQLIVGYDPERRSDKFKIVIDLSNQRAVMYKNGSVHMSSRVSTGKSGHRTPTGEYVVTHKHRTWTSTLYHSPMPYFMRLSCKAIGTHVGYVPDYPASHGCIRMPHDSAKEFFNAAPRGTPVSIIN